MQDVRSPRSKGTSRRLARTGPRASVSPPLARSSLRRQKGEDRKPGSLPGAAWSAMPSVGTGSTESQRPPQGSCWGRRERPGWTGRGGGGRSPSEGQAVRSPQTREAHGAWESLRRPRGLPLPWRECGGASRAEETSPVRHSQLRACVPASPAAPDLPRPGPPLTLASRS